MKVNIEELENIPDKQITCEFRETINELDNGRAVIGLITFTIAGSRIRVKGHVETDINLECDRCLISFPYHVDIDIDESFIKGNLEPAKEFELTSDSFIEELAGRKDIDLNDLVHQAIILDIPGKKLCNTECKGFEGNKDIDTVKTDPRMNIFKTISEQIN